MQENKSGCFILNTVYKEVLKSSASPSAKSLLKGYSGQKNKLAKSAPAV